MTKRTRRLLIGAVALALVLLIGGIAAASRSQGPKMTTDTVVRGTVKKTLDISGNLQKADDIDLAFATAGVLSGVPVRVGQEVAQGDILALLDAGDLAANVAVSEAALQEAQANFALAIEGASTEERAQSSAAVLRAETDLTNAQVAYDDAVATAESAVTQAEDDYAQAQGSAAASRSAAAVNLANANDAAIVAVRNAISSADAVLGEDNELVNDAFESRLGTLNPQTVGHARRAYTTASATRDAAEEAVFAADASGDPTAAYADITTAFADASDLLYKVAVMLNATFIDSREFSADDLEALKASIASARTTLAAADTAYQSAQQTYDDALRSADALESDAQNALTLAEAQRDQSIASAAGSVAAAEAALAAQQASDAVVTAGPRDAELTALQAAVARAQASYTAALATLSHAQIVAPIDGIVTDIAYDVGEYVTPGTRVVRIESPDDAFVLTLDVAESDVAEIALGQAAHVTVDALGDGVYDGQVVAVAPAQKDIEGAVFYEAEVLLTTTSASMRAGMSADAVIDVAERNDVLRLAQRGVLRRGDEYYVRIPAENEASYEERTVTVGLRGDDGIVEITSGVNDGDVVILRIEE